MSLIMSLQLKYLLRRLKTDPAGAIPKLGRLGDKRAVPELTALLNDPKYYSTDLVTALGQLGDRSAAEPLLDKMGRVYTGQERKLIAAALKNLGQPQWTDMIKGDNDDWGRIAQSGDRLAYIPLGASLGIIAYIELKLAAIIRLGDRRSIGSVLEALCGDWSTGSIRRSAASALARLGEPQWEGIITGENSDWEALGNSKDARLIGPLERALLDIDGALQKNASEKKELEAIARLQFSARIEDRIAGHLNKDRLGGLGANAMDGLARLAEGMQRVRAEISKALQCLVAGTKE